MFVIEPIITMKDGYKSLEDDEMKYLLDAQMAVLKVGGSLCLNDQMSFVLAKVNGMMSGILAHWPNGPDETWIQIAYVDPEARRNGICKQMIKHLMFLTPETKRLGFGTQPTNAAMIRIAEQCGMRQKALYFYR